MSVNTNLSFHCKKKGIFFCELKNAKRLQLRNKRRLSGQTGPNVFTTKHIIGSMGDEAVHNRGSGILEENYFEWRRIHVWRVFTWFIRNLSVPLEASVHRFIYFDIIPDLMHPFIDVVFTNGYAYLQQDNAPRHEVVNNFRLV